MYGALLTIYCEDIQIVEQNALSVLFVSALSESAVCVVCAECTDHSCVPHGGCPAIPSDLHHKNTVHGMILAQHHKPARSRLVLGVPKMC